MFAGAAIGYEAACWAPMITDHGAAELLEEAVAMVGAERSDLRVALLSGLARALGLRGDQTDGLTVRGRPSISRGGRATAPDSPRP